MATVAHLMFIHSPTDQSYDGTEYRDVWPVWDSDHCSGPTVTWTKFWLTWAHLHLWLPFGRLLTHCHQLSPPTYPPSSAFYHHIHSTSCYYFSGQGLLSYQCSEGFSCTYPGPPFVRYQALLIRSFYCTSIMKSFIHETWPWAGSEWRPWLVHKWRPWAGYKQKPWLACLNRDPEQQTSHQREKGSTK